MQLEVDLGDMPTDELDLGMIRGLRSLLGANELCDVSLVAGGQTFAAHRAVLAAVSASFHDCLSQLAVHEISPSKPLVLNFDDVKYPEAVRAMLDCIYGHDNGSSPAYNPSSGDANRDVLRLAQRFQIQPLVDTASLWLATGLATDNILDRLLACEEFGLSAVRSHIMSQLIANPDALFVMARDPNMIKAPAVLQDLLLRILKLLGCEAGLQQKAISSQGVKAGRKAGA